MSYIKFLERRTGFFFLCCSVLCFSFYLSEFECLECKSESLSVIVDVAKGK